MTPDSILSTLAGGGALGIIGMLAVILIKQVNARSGVTTDQNENWQRLLAAEQDATTRCRAEADLAREDVRIARRAIDGLTMEIGRLEDELAAIRRARD